MGGAVRGLDGGVVVVGVLDEELDEEVDDADLKLGVCGHVFEGQTIDLKSEGGVGEVVVEIEEVEVGKEKVGVCRGFFEVMHG